jgi:hypothetical protein
MAAMNRVDLSASHRFIRVDLGDAHAFSNNKHEASLACAPVRFDLG